MLEAARTKFAPDEQIEVRTADATSLPFPKGAFNAVVCQFRVMFFLDKERSYREVHRSPASQASSESREMLAFAHVTTGTSTNEGFDINASYAGHRRDSGFD